MTTVLGRGGFGEVQKVTINGTEYAKKIIRDDIREDLNIAVVTEPMFMQMVQHPNMVPALKVTYQDDQLEILMPLMPDDLASAVPDDKRMSIKQLLSAGYYMERNWIMHRDIKPGNILLNANGEPQLTDWSLAIRLIDAGQPLSFRVQTMFYRAPEVVLRRHYDTRIDVWSMGLTILEMYTRRVTFYVDNEEQLLREMIRLLNPDREMLRQMRVKPDVLNTQSVYSGVEAFVKAQNIGDEAIETVLIKMLQFFPDQRASFTQLNKLPTDLTLNTYPVYPRVRNPQRYNIIRMLKRWTDTYKAGWSTLVYAITIIDMVLDDEDMDPDALAFAAFIISSRLNMAQYVVAQQPMWRWKEDVIRVLRKVQFLPMPNARITKNAFLYENIIKGDTNVAEVQDLYFPRGAPEGLTQFVGQILR